MGCVNCCKRKEASGNRTVYALRQPSAQLADDVPMQKFCSNEIISSRYTWLSFLPKNLFEQFHNLANIFFATIAVLYMFASAATSIWANLGPLIAIIAISMIKDGVDDLFRHRRDRRINCALFRTLRVDSYAKTIRWSATEAQDIRVGDIVLCEEDRTLPCDMVALCSSHNSTALNVTTANLDGETNVKKLYALTPTQSMYACYAPEKLSMNPVKPRDYYGTLNHLYVRVDCSDPSEEFGKFEGRLTTHGRSHIPLSMKNLVLRGSKLHNTEFVIGLAVYTGRETKLSLNGKQSKRKYSSREARSNIILLCFIFAMIIISLVLTIVFTVMTTQTKDTRWYIPVARQTRWEFVQNVFRYVTIVNYLIPISIIITMEFQQLLIAFFISNDLRMYDEQEDLVAKANSSQLADELGQVEFLFCDKTGTLTQNVMWLSVCAVIDTDKIYDFQQRPAQQTTDSPMPASKILNGGTNVLVSSSSSESDSEYSTIESAGRLKNKYNRLKPDTSPELSRFLTMSALCHTVEATDTGVSESELGVSRTGKYHYEAASPDEKALVEGAARLGVVYAGCQPADAQPSTLLYTVEHWMTDPDSNPIDLMEVRHYFVDAILEFTSTRKRMSVMVRHPDGTCHVHSKGAEVSMLSAEVCTKCHNGLYNLVMQRANEIAREGYRTLVFSSRQLSKVEYQKLLREFRATSGMLGVNRQKALNDVYAKIETELQPMYVAGIEDVLYPGVKKCLNGLREAGIQVWILTGDKEETAVTVSQSAGHFTPQMGLIRMTHCPDYATAACWVFEQLEGIQARLDLRTRGPHGMEKRTSLLVSHEELTEAYLTAAETELSTKRDEILLKDRLKRLRSRLQTFISWESRNTRGRVFRSKGRRRAGGGGEPIGLVVDGKTLGLVLDPTLREAFLDLCMNVTTVLCCRLTPLQKASVVQLVQTGLSRRSRDGATPVTAAIGDGGNDVAMLLQASIGVGIYGKEGLDAARAADYSVPSFEHLLQLFLLHGNWAYHRISFTMGLFYYKCTALVTTQILFGFYSGFSQMVSISSLLFALYNLTMTSVNCLLYGMFERHLPEKELLSLPYLYRAISRQANLRAWFVPIWVLEGIWTGCIIFFMTIYCLGGGLDYAPAVAFDGTLNGRSTYDFWSIGTATYMYLWMAVNLRILILFRDWNGFIGLGYGVTAINIALFYASNRIIFVALVASPTFWLTMIPTLYMTCFPAFIWRMLSDMWWNMHIYLSSIPQRRIRHKQRRDWKCWLSALSQGRVTKNVTV